MPVDSAHWEHLKHWIVTKRADIPTCAICASGGDWANWEVEAITALLLDTTGGIARPVGRSLWSIALICRSCGALILFDMDRIGLDLPYVTDVSRPPDSAA